MSKLQVGTSAAGKPIFKYTGGVNDPEYQKDIQAGFKQTTPTTNMLNIGGGQTGTTPSAQAAPTQDSSPLLNILKFLAPRTVEAVQGGAAAMQLGQKAPEVQQITDTAFKQSQDIIKQARATTDPTKKAQLLQQSRDIMGKASTAPDVLQPLIAKAEKVKSPLRTGIGIAGEAATWALPVAAEFKGATALARIGESASLGGVMGAIHGVTDPEEKPLPTRIGDGVKQALGGAVAGAVLGGGIEAARALVTRLSGFGKWLVRGIVKPEAGTGAGWSEREIQATNDILEHTKGSTPGALDRSLTQYLKDTTAEIRSQLEPLSDTPLRTNAVKDEISKAIENSVQGYKKLDYGDELSRIYKIIDDYSTPSGKGIETTNSALSLFDAKSKGLASYLEKNKVWDRLEKDPGALSIEDKMGITAYDTLKNLIEREWPGTSALTEIEHRLLQGSKGVYKWGHRYKSPDLWNLRALPIANRIFDAIETGEMAAGRALGNLTPESTAIQALGSDQVRRTLNLIIAGGITQAK